MSPGNCIPLSPKLLCTLAVLVALAIDDLRESTVAAQSPATLSGECRKLYRSWQQKGGIGAFVASRNGSCGWAADFLSIADARGAAITACRKSQGKRCKVIAENQRPPPGYMPTLKGASEAIPLKTFQAKLKLSAPEMKLRFGAAGKIMCPSSSGTVFLVERPDVFVTADHIFVDPDKQGEFRKGISKCWVQFFFSKRRYSIKANSLVHGFKTNKTAYQFVWYDWAIGQLDRPVADVQPFAISPVIPAKDLSVSIVSKGMNDEVPRVCIGQITSAWGNYSVNDITTTCSGGPGSSGGPLFIGPIDQVPKFPLQAIGFTRGYTFLNDGTKSLQALPLMDKEMRSALDQLLKKLNEPPPSTE